MRRSSLLCWHCTCSRCLKSFGHDIEKKKSSDFMSATQSKGKCTPMKFALLQFPISKNPIEIYQKIKQAITQSKSNGADILITQECALSGYPPIEIESVGAINFEQQNIAFQEIIDLVKKNKIYLLLGLIRQDNEEIKNSTAIISPSGQVDFYDKRALWGWDLDNFAPGTNSHGVIDIQGIKIGIRICFEIRFPEYFRELYKADVDIAIVNFCDLSQEPNPDRLSIIKSHLLTRAIENTFTVISVNSTTYCQTAPTGVINPDGRTLIEAKLNEESIIYYDYKKHEPGFGTKGRIHYSNHLTAV